MHPFGIVVMVPSGLRCSSVSIMELPLATLNSFSEPHANREVYSITVRSPNLGSCANCAPVNFAPPLK